MSDTIREQIISAIVTRLAVVRQSKGYVTDCGAVVRRTRRMRDTDETDALIVWPGIETASRSYSKITAIMPVEIEGQVSFEIDENPSEMAESVMGDIIEAMTGPYWTLAYTSGGTYVVKVCDTITGDVSDATGYIEAITTSSGSWAAGTAAGNFTVRRISGTFGNETVSVGSNSNVATVAGSTISATSAITAATGGLADSIEYIGGGVENYPDESSSIVGVVVRFNISYKFNAGNPYSQ